MVEALNHRVELLTAGTSFLKLNSYGQIMIGDRGFEFYDQRDPHNYIQIPWREVDYVVASLFFGDRWIPRFAIRTKRDGQYLFAAKQPKVVLRAMRQHVPADHLVRALTMRQTIKRGLREWLKSGNKS